MLIDTHIHLYSKKFDDDRDAVIQRAREAGVEILVLPAVDVPSIEASVELSERHGGVHAMAAIHPTETREATDADFEAVRSWCGHASIVAVGETGLDYYWDRSFDAQQHEFFRRHIRLAMEADLPLVLHSRDKKDRTEVHEVMVRMLNEERAASEHPERLRGVFHCFGGPDWLPAEAEKLGFVLGIGGTLTFKNGGVDRLVADVPLSRIVLETDAPYLAPEPHRGRRNEPAFVRLVAERLADLKGVSVEEVERVTTENAKRLYRLD
ncbi:MAG TPA: TatD family hydrolase [Rhodothermales bacterium]